MTSFQEDVLPHGRTFRGKGTLYPTIKRARPEDIITEHSIIQKIGLDRSKYLLLAIVSGTLIAISLPGFDYFPAAFAGIAVLFFALRKRNLFVSIANSALAGFTSGAIYFTWALQASRQYTGAVSGESVAIYLALCLYQASWYGIFGAGYFFTSKYEKKSSLLFVVVIASLWVSWEWLYSHAIPSFPWITISPYTQWNDIFLMQWGSIGGMWIISFILAASSAGVYLAITRRSWKVAGATVVAMALVFYSGFVMYANAVTESGAPIRLSLIQENIAAKERWNQSFADSLGDIFIGLNKETVRQKPELIAWTETALPWAFSTDDALIDSVLNITYTTGASHLIGMLTRADVAGDVYNSVYYVNPDGAITGRYDKTDLLMFLERPLLSAGWMVPFRQSVYNNILPGERGNVIATKYGAIGIMICNESLSPGNAIKAVRNGARVLYVPGNDSWFYHSSLDLAHLALTRMRAIETRRDIIYDANRGYAGIIRASGKLDVTSPSEDSRALPETVYTHHGETIYSRFPDAVMYLAFPLVFVASVSQRRISTKPRRNNK
jgi:apolipoprotein N-acyltransferase